ncbi:MAG: hypothetical protein A3A22_02045, partial [Candidatus Taylorbacteria bacterium RIFCSPLOWO2_01_FULL_45_34b]
SDISYQWMLEHERHAEFWSSFEVCHIHYGFEFERLEIVQKALSLLKQRGKPFVFTCHEICSVHGVSPERYDEYLRLILDNASEVMTLTDVAKQSLQAKYQNVSDVAVVPHGYVVLPEEFRSERKETAPSVPEVLLFGALRSNRDTAATIVNLSLNTALKCRIAWVTRPFTHQQLAELSVLRTALELVKGNPRVQLELTLPLTDDEVAARVGATDVLLLPYLSGSHSGQLELSFDCGVLPVTTDVGFLSSQRGFWPAKSSGIPNAVMANWTDGKEWLYQARFMVAVRDALMALPAFKSSVDLGARKSFRALEHQSIVERHISVYSRVLARKE